MNRFHNAERDYLEPPADRFTQEEIDMKCEELASERVNTEKANKLRLDFLNAYEDVSAGEPPQCLWEALDELSAYLNPSDEDAEHELGRD